MFWGIVVELLDRFGSLVGELVDTDWQRASDEDLVVALRQIEDWGRQVHMVSLALTRVVDERGVARERGATSTSALLRQVLGISPREATRRVQTAQDVISTVTPTGSAVPPVLAVAARALRAGEISDEHLQVVRAALRDLPDDVGLSVRGEVEDTLVRHAREFDPMVLGRLAKRIQVHLNPDGTLRSDTEAAARRELVISRGQDGMYQVRGRLDAEAATTVLSALSPLSAPLPAANGEKDSRTGAQRQADALVELARRMLTAGELPVEGGQRPQVILSVAYETLAKGLDNAGVSTFVNGEPITAQAARRIACDSSVIPVVLGSRSEPLDVGRSQRTATTAIRRALIARDGGCSFPHCDRPPQWTEAHHVVSWLDWGDTKVENMALLCVHHHTVVHDQGWEIVMIDDHPHFIPPGWVDIDQTPRRNHLHRPLG